MTRRLCMAAFLASALLCVGSAAAWIISERYTEAVSAPLPGECSIGVLIDRGTLAGWFGRDPLASRWEWMHRKAVGRRFIDIMSENFSPGGRFGFALDWGRHEKAMCVPLWFVSALGLIGTIVSAKLVRRRPRKGFCSHCGYDLCASKDCCPECGAAIQQQAQAEA